MEQAIRHAFEDREKELNLEMRELGEKNAWTLFGLPSKEHVKRLCEQEAIYNEKRRQLVVFRPLRKLPNLTRVFIINSVHKDHVETIKEWLIQHYENTDIVITTPGHRTGMDRGEILVVVKNKDKEKARTWKKPDNIPRIKLDNITVPKMETRNAPHCYLCHSNHHVADACPWTQINKIVLDTTTGETRQ